MTSSIEWLTNPDGSKGETWNPVVGCSRVSPGCDNCYAIGVAGRNLCEQHRGLTKIRPRDAARPGIDWSGEVRTVPHLVRVPLRWRKARRIFVNSMSDLWHKNVPDEFIDEIFTVMLVTSLCEGGPRHTYLTLTKRAERMLEYLAADNLPERLGKCAGQMMEDGDGWHDLMWHYVREHGAAHEQIHVGVSAENQETWDERVPLLLRARAAVRWVSIEPQLGPIDMSAFIVPKRYHPDDAINAEVAADHAEAIDYDAAVGLREGWHRGWRSLDWVVAGGESGRGARPYDVGWARSIVEQGTAAHLPVFLKQLGARPMTRAHRPDELHGRAVDGPDREWPLGTLFTTAPGHMGTPWQGRWARLKDRKGKDMSEWPADLRVRQYPTARASSSRMETP